MKLPTSKSKIQNKSKIPNPNVKEIREYSAVYNLRDWLLIFARRILQICTMLPKTPECENIRRQLGRAGTSVGANFEEADGSLTKKDFVNKVGIARKEAKETKYWLRIISGTYLQECDMARDIREAGEIINIFSSILIKSGAGKRR